MPRLKAKYEDFCRSYMNTANASEAARAAGYAFESAAQQGHRLLRKPAIAARLAELRAELVARECHGDAQLAKLELAFRTAINKGQPAAAARVVEAQTKLALLLGSTAPRADDGLPPGSESTRAALTRIARHLGIPGPTDGAQKSAT
jgi:hypothetical protein